MASQEEKDLGQRADERQMSEPEPDAVLEEASEAQPEAAGKPKRGIRGKLGACLKDKRAIYIVPNAITLISMFFGFLSITWSIQGDFSTACIALLLSALMDGLDGKVARLTNSASEFGVQFDSLADLVAFGIAPAVLMYQWQLNALGRFGATIAFVYAACGALRLARFNISAHSGSKRYFMGLPIPAGSCTLVCFVFFAMKLLGSWPTLTLVLATLMTFFVGLLMVSKVRYFSFKEYDIFIAHPCRTLVAFLLLLSLLYIQPQIVGFVYCALYIAMGIVYTYVLLPKHTTMQLLRSSSSEG